MMFVFRESSRLAAAYGSAVTGDMTITGIQMASIFYHKRDIPKTISLLITFVYSMFLLSNGYKIPHGGY
jgi:KUP system potassium uptake protein